MNFKILFTTSLLLSLWSTHAAAFCGMYVSKKEDAELLNEATQVVLFRDGLTTAVTMQNSYKGPVDDFAMLVPVPQVLEKKDVETLDPDTISRLAAFTSPRLSAYEKRVRCNEPEPTETMGIGMLGAEKNGLAASGTSGAEGTGGVTVRERFDAGEYEIKVLEATDSTGLLDWLERESYNIPKGGEELLQGYINAGMYFFVAKVDATKVTFDKKGRAELSPLRFSYSSEDFSLPVRLGMVNADGPQDLLIHTISPQGRYESSNYLTGIMPTNLIVQSKVQKNFASFYTSLYKRVRTKQEATLMTEFVGFSSPRQKCDPCTSADPVFSEAMLAPFVSFGRSNSYETRYRVQTHVRGGTVESRDRLEHALATLIADRCFNEAQFFVSRVSKLSAVQDLTFEVDAETGSLTWTDSDIRGMRILPEHESTAYRQCVADTLSTFEKPDGVGLSSGHTYRTRMVYRFERTRQITDTQRDTLLSLTVTRMRGTFSPGETTEDIVFALDDPLTGGYGTPKLEDDTMTHFYTESEEEINRFQSRYIIIESDIDAQIKKCSKVLGWSVYWTSPSKGSFEAEPMSMTEKPKFSTKQLRRLIQNEDQAGVSL